MSSWFMHVEVQTALSGKDQVSLPSALLTKHLSKNLCYTACASLTPLTS